MEEYRVTKLGKMNFWLIVVTVSVSLVYCGWFVYHELTHPAWCCDGPCLEVEEIKE